MHRYLVKQTKEGLLHEKSHVAPYKLQTETWQNTETKPLLNLSRKAPVLVDYTPFIKAFLGKHRILKKKKRNKETEDAVFNPVFLYIISYPFFLVFVSI